MSVCGFPIINELNQIIAHCNLKAGHPDSCVWLLSNDEPPAMETLAEGILRRVGEMDGLLNHAHAALHEGERVQERMTKALGEILSKGDAWAQDIARLGLGLQPLNPDVKLP